MNDKQEATITSLMQACERKQSDKKSAPLKSEITSSAQLLPAVNEAVVL